MVLTSRMLGWTGHALGFGEDEVSTASLFPRESGWRVKMTSNQCLHCSFCGVKHWHIRDKCKVEMNFVGRSAFICPSQSKFVIVIKYVDISPSPAHGVVCSTDMKVYLAGKKQSWKCFRSYELRPATAVWFNSLISFFKARPSLYVQFNEDTE